LAGWAARLATLRDERALAPLESPVELLANEISAAIDGGELAPRDIDRAIQALSLQGFLARAARLRRYLGEIEPEKNDEIIRRLVRGLTVEQGKARSFDSFRRIVESERTGIVLTAHPTFALSAELTRLLALLATGR